MRRQVRDYVAPEVRRSRIAVQKNDRVALPDVDVGHLDAGGVEALARMGIGGGIDASLMACLLLARMSLRDTTRPRAAQGARKSRLRRRAAIADSVCLRGERLHYCRLTSRGG